MPWRAPLCSDGLARLSVAGPGTTAPLRKSLTGAPSPAGAPSPSTRTTMPLPMQTAEPTLAPPAAAAGPAHRVLSEVFGLAGFRGLQQTIVEHTIGGGDS